MEHDIIRRPRQSDVDPAKGLAQDLGQELDPFGPHLFVGRAVLLGQDPSLEREAGRVGLYGDEPVVVTDQSPSVSELLADDVAKDTAFLVFEVAL